jgi:hypothetical protein
VSTIKVTNIKNASTDNGGIAIDGTGHVQVDGVQMPTAGALSNRNKIINGDMRVAQRGTSFTGTSKYPADRWTVGGSTSVVLTSQNESTEVPTGFQNSAKLSITTADSSIAAGDAWDFTQHIEGYNVADLLFGTANAKSVTLSFWVNCTSTGTFCIVLLGSSDGVSLDRSYVAEYTINTADTWEQKTITVPGDTGGTWHTGNGRGLSVRFGLTAGTTYQKAAGSWGAGNVIGSSNQTQLLSTANSEWYVTGVQLEVGSKATGFEYRSYGDELARCQRYYQKMTGTVGNRSFVNMAAWSSSSVYGVLPFQQVMRSAPTVTDSGNFEVYSGGITPSVSSLDFERITVDNCRVFASTSGLTTGRAAWLEPEDSSGATIEFSAEL